MKDQDILVARGAPYFIPWLEDEKRKKVDLLVGQYRRGEDTRNTQAEIMVLSDLISGLKSKHEALGKLRTP